MIENLKAKTEKETAKFLKEIDEFRNLLVQQTPENLQVSKVKKFFCAENQEVAYLVGLEQKNPTRGSRKVDISINIEGLVSCEKLLEVRDYSEGVEYVEANEIVACSLKDLRKKKLEPFQFLTKYDEIRQWILSGN